MIASLFFRRGISGAAAGTTPEAPRDHVVPSTP
jgi:hypothetical protein